MTYSFGNICRSFCSFEQWIEGAWTWNRRKKQTGFSFCHIHLSSPEERNILSNSDRMYGLVIVTRHLITTRYTTHEALSDGLYVAPAIETADYHASLNKNSWFYVFDYQSKYGDYKTVSKIIAYMKLNIFSWNVVMVSELTWNFIHGSFNIAETGLYPWRGDWLCFW